MWFDQKCSLPKSVSRILSYLEITAGSRNAFGKIPVEKKRKKMSTKNVKTFDPQLKSKVKHFKYEMLQDDGPSFVNVALPLDIETKEETIFTKSKYVVTGSPIRSSLRNHNRVGFKRQQEQENSYNKTRRASASIPMMVDEKGKPRRDSEGVPMMIEEEKQEETSFRFSQNEEHVTIASLLLSDFLCELRVPLLSTSFYEQFAIAQKRRDKLMMRALCSSMHCAHAELLRRLIHLFRILLEPRYATKSGLTLDIVLEKWATKLGTWILSFIIITHSYEQQHIRR